MAAVAEEVQAFFVGELLDGAAPNGLGSSTLLIEEGLLDSLGIFELVAWIEERYHVDVRAEDVVIENFRTLDTITRFVEASVG